MAFSAQDEERARASIDPDEEPMPSDAGRLVLLKCCDTAMCSSVMDAMSASSASSASGQRSVVRAERGGDASEAWTLDTKYYTAEIQLHAVEGCDPKSLSQIDRDLMCSAEAIVVVFDAHDDASFKAAVGTLSNDEAGKNELGGEQEAYGEEDDDRLSADVRLAVGVISNCGPHARVPRTASCWGNTFRQLGFELVLVVSPELEIDDATADVRRMLQASDLCLDECSSESQDDVTSIEPIMDCFDGGGGFRRMADALQCVYWPGLTLKERTEGAPPPLEDEEEQYATDDTAKSSNGVAAAEATEAEGQKSEEEEEAALEREMADFEKMMAAVMQARADALAADDLNDGDSEISEGTRRRREIAAEVAMRMLDQFGLGDADDGR